MLSILKSTALLIKEDLVFILKIGSETNLVKSDLASHH